MPELGVHVVAVDPVRFLPWNDMTPSSTTAILELLRKLSRCPVQVLVVDLFATVGVAVGEHPHGVRPRSTLSKNRTTPDREEAQGHLAASERADEK